MRVRVQNVGEGKNELPLKFNSEGIGTIKWVGSKLLQALQHTLKIQMIILNKE